MSASLEGFLKLKKKEKVETIKKNWEKTIVIGLGIILCLVILSVGMYNMWESMVTSNDLTYVDSPSGFGRDLVRVTSVTPTKKSNFIFLVALSCISTLLFFMRIDLVTHMEKKWKLCLSTSEKIYMTFKHILIYTFGTYFISVSLYFLGSFISPLIF